MYGEVKEIWTRQGDDNNPNGWSRRRGRGRQAQGSEEYIRVDGWNSVGQIQDEAIVSRERVERGREREKERV
jgi:hypothetical protein